MNPSEYNVHVAHIAAELEKAEAKYPVFCNSLTHKDNSKMANAGWLGLMRHRSCCESEGGYSFEATIEEELAEVFEAWFDKDYTHCLEELAQCGAVIVRAMQFITKQMEADNGNNG